MGDRKAPRPVPTNQVRPAPPPAPPRKRVPAVEVTVRVVGACALFSTEPMTCPFCGTFVPANTHHRRTYMEPTK